MNSYIRERKRERRRKLMTQRLMGILMIILAIIATYIASQGTTVIDRDGTGAILMYLLGFTALFSRQCFIF